MAEETYDPNELVRAFDGRNEFDIPRYRADELGLEIRETDASSDTVDTQASEELVRARDSRNEFTLPRRIAEAADGVTIVDKPAVDTNGVPLAGKAVNPHLQGDATPTAASVPTPNTGDAGPTDSLPGAGGVPDGPDADDQEETR